MKHYLLKAFTKSWNLTFSKHPLIEAFCLSVLFHILALNFLWLCYEIHVMVFPQNEKQRVINIEFIK